jgi:hypothetical protein
MAHDQQPTHQITVGGRFNLNNQVIDCPQCGAVRGLTFAVFPEALCPRGSCPGGHVWDECRVPAEAVREAARRVGR